MAMRSLCAIALLVAFVALNGAAAQDNPATPANAAGPAVADAAFLRDLAAQDRAHAQDARQRAKVWEEMAARARASVAQSSGTFKEGWEQSAADDARFAKQLNDEAERWEREARELDGRAAAAEQSAAAAAPAAPAPPPCNCRNPPVPAGTASTGDPLAPVLGEWLDPVRKAKITIARENPADTRSALVLKGSHADWKGTYTPANGTQPAQVVFRRKPGWKEMEPAAPPWALQQAEGHLEWILELSLDLDCLPKLRGKWYKGEVKWRDVGGRTAQWASYVNAEAIEYDRQPSVDLALTGRPGIQVVTRRDFPWPAEALDRDQGFFVEVRLSNVDAQAQGRQLTVRIVAHPSGRSIDVILTGAPRRSGPAVYTTDASIVFEKPFEIAGPSDLVYSPADSVNLEKLGLKNGDLVTVSLVPQTWGDVSTSFLFYDSWVQQGIARNEAGFDDLDRAYRVALDSAPDAKARDVLKRKIQLIADARDLLGPGRKEQFTDLQRYYIGNAYHGVLLTDTYDVAAGLAGRNREWTTGPYFWDPYKIQLVDSGEGKMVVDAMEEGRAKFKEDFMHAVPAGLALGLYHLVAQLSGGSQIVMAAFSIDEDGNPVYMVDRIFAGVSFASSGLFSVASAKYLTELSPDSTAQGGSPPDDQPFAKDFEINPDSPATIRRTVEGGRIPFGSVNAVDEAMAKSLYGPNARLRPLDPGEPGILQVTNYDCSIEVVRVHVLAGTGRNIPEMSLRHTALQQRLARPMGGIDAAGYVALVQQQGGRAAFRDVDLPTLQVLRDANYYVNITLKWPDGGYHAVDFKGFAVEGGQQVAIWNDPYLGGKVTLPICDFAKIFLIQPGRSVADPSKGTVKIADFGQAQPITFGGRTFPPLRDRP